MDVHRTRPLRMVVAGVAATLVTVSGAGAALPASEPAAGRSPAATVSPAAGWDGAAVGQESVTAAGGQDAEERVAVTASKRTAMWTTARVNVRTGPGVKYQRVRTLPARAKVTVVAKRHGWCRLASGRYVSARYLTAKRPAVPSPVGKVVWSTFVANAGGQRAVNACSGGLTRFTAATLPGKTYYAIHRGCGGAPILSLKHGHRVHIRGVGTFRVIDSGVGWGGAPISSIAHVKGSVLLQTCFPNGGGKARVVGLARA